MPAAVATDDCAHRRALARALFAPRGIALIGATADPAGFASRPQRVLRRHGYHGTIVPVGSATPALAGDAEGPLPLEHAFIMVAPAAVPAAIRQCAAAGIAVATIFSAGFAELGARGRRRQEEMVAAARRAGLRLLGPNSLGVVDVPGGMVLSANAVFENEPLRAGGLSLVSQSGSMLGGVLTRAQERGLGFSKLISVGNECDIGVGELVHLLVDDADTQAILLFLETFRDAGVLGAAARRAFAAGKPVIALKLGRTAAGREIAATHTGALVGADDAAGAFFTHHGILRVETLEALFETAQLVLGHAPAKRRRVAALTVSAGAAALVIDRLAQADIELVAPDPALAAQLAAEKIRIGSGPLIDLPMGRADGGAYTRILDALLASEQCDAVLAIQGSNAAHDPRSVHERLPAAALGAKPLAVFVAPRAQAALRKLQEAGVAAFRTPESCADALRAYLHWRAPALPVELSSDEAQRLARTLRSAGRTPMNEHQAACLLADIGIPVTPACIMRHPDDPAQVAFPAAAKILSPDIAHKSEVGGVVLDIPDMAALRASVARLLACAGRNLPQARIDGVLVQPMQRGLAEAIVGLRRDPEVGPVVMVGVGGVLAELHTQRALRLAPVSVEAALEMIAGVPALGRLRGQRVRPDADLQALAQVVHRLSLLARVDDPLVVEAEINPLIVRSEGVIAVDALVRCTTPSCHPGAPPS